MQFLRFVQVLKVHLSAQPEVYGRAPGEVTGDKVNKNLLFDSSSQHLYITTEKKVWLIIRFAESISLTCHPSTASVSPHGEGQLLRHVPASAFRLSSIRSGTWWVFHSFSLSCLIIYSLVQLTPIDPSTLLHKVTHWLIHSFSFSLTLFVSFFICLSFVL